MRTVYVNGEYLPENEAKISIFDRGFLMADGVYEVTSVLDGKLIDFDGHAKRLERSLNELQMPHPAVLPDLLEVHRELVRLNGIEEGMIYLQITRGAPGDREPPGRAGARDVHVPGAGEGTRFCPRAAGAHGFLVAEEAR